jgi:phosphoglycolate phosphatase-like HAD superfamily hydrolase
MKSIAIDGDGVLLDYNAAYAHAWQRAFGEIPALRNPNAYWPMDRWAVQHLTGASLEKLRSNFDEEFWSTIPAVPGAVEACEALTRHGHELVCVTALDERFASARARNLRSLGFPIARVITTDNTVSNRSPKAHVLNTLRPVAFVEDYAPYLMGVDASIHLALIMRDADGSPNTGELMQLPNSQHSDLLGFANWWTRDRSEQTRVGG